MKSRWSEFIFIGLVLILATIYLSHPQRSAQWNTTQSWWQSFVASGLFKDTQQTEKHSENPREIIYQARYNLSQITTLATFDETEYLGCDTMINPNEVGELQLLLVTYWRDKQHTNEVYSAHFRFINFTLKSVTEEIRGLNWEGEWAWAVFPLDEEALKEGQGWVTLYNLQGDKLPVVSDVLGTERGTDLLIWSR